MIKTLTFITGCILALTGATWAAPKTLTLNQSSYPANTPIVATFSGGPGNNNDWIGIFPSTVTTPSTGTYLAWLYTNGTQTPGGNLKNGSVTFPNAAGLPPGNYKAWFLANNGYTVLAGPKAFSVTSVGGPTPPVWLVSPFSLRHAVQAQAYTGRIGAYAYDPDQGDALTFAKVSGPAWLSVSSTGELTGTPSASDSGTNTFVVKAVDMLGNSTNATLTIPVFATGQEQVSQIKVMSYNLFHGWGQMNDGQNKGLDSVILSGADIIGTQETVDNASGSNAYQVQTIANQLGWYYSPTGAGDSGIASRYPIVNTFTVGVAKGVRIRICTSPLREVVLVNTHLDYLYYGPYAAKLAGSTNASVLTEELRSQRDEQIAAIISGISSYLSAANTTPVFLTGDFNCPSHLDWTTANSSAHYGKVVEWPVTKALANAGMTDSVRQLYPNPVTNPFITWSPIYSSPNEPQDRIDFVLHKGTGVTPVAAQMFTTPVEHSGYVYGDSITATRDNTWPSDHASIIVTFQFNP
ncbi:endonuclease/exonuclease/phosphatase family protein [Luteolibacter ambystomatis]|uniref:Endonuclease/exonuclease/phosphatase family protein n=1 Tax=Luteolibacter ambystomatis TaxID=2824561 RepID=A0A975GA81_9BACT|nr:endonuclease/exonuclease/phosphatase family protein [Luteolibacter ambystomatis]QUE51430.1 endonuclease/exonuclease/phosphatase family protein [Luteolibacter ambystomatis]